MNSLDSLARRLARWACPFVLCAALAGCGAAKTGPSVLPVLDARVLAHVTAIYRRGFALGNRPDVFAKVGDSNTATQSFLRGIGCGIGDFAQHQRLRATVRFFGHRILPPGYTPFLFATPLPCPNNSYVRIGFSAHPGWSVASLLGPVGPEYFLTYFHGRYLPGRRRIPGGKIIKVERRPSGRCPGVLDQALRCELHVIRPSLALIMIGTNDLANTPVAHFDARLKSVVEEVTASGTIPVLSTIPPFRSDRYASRVRALNAVIAKAAETNELPLWDFWSALERPGMVNHGLGPDQVHLSVYNQDPINFRPVALRYGANLRNLQALEILDLFRRRLFAG